ncbi:MAG: hypothetical protein EA425_06075 [Puniceicoccaceae bacterium]|nr:MAG: hypothetical protein EA425_06075 [Puniceicoccaceae bacterium]
MTPEELNRAREWITAYVDGELPPGEAARLLELIRTHPELKEDLDACLQAKQLTTMTTHQSPPDAVWTTYWSGVYNRIERKLGWILFYAGAIPLTLYGIYHLLESLLGDTELAWWIRLAILAAAAGLLVLLVSITRERLHLHRNERYRDIQR